MCLSLTNTAVESLADSYTFAAAIALSASEAGDIYETGVVVTVGGKQYQKVIVAEKSDVSALRVQYIDKVSDNSNGGDVRSDIPSLLPRCGSSSGEGVQLSSEFVMNNSGLVDCAFVSSPSETNGFIERGNVGRVGRSSVVTVNLYDGERGSRDRGRRRLQQAQASSVSYTTSVCYPYLIRCA